MATATKAVRHFMFIACLLDNMVAGDIYVRLSPVLHNLRGCYFLTIHCTLDSTGYYGHLPCIFPLSPRARRMLHVSCESWVDDSGLAQSLYKYKQGSRNLKLDKKCWIILIELELSKAWMLIENNLTFCCLYDMPDPWSLWLLFSLNKAEN